MKILTFVKLASIVVLCSGGISSAVIFSNINSVSTPFARILTKNQYLEIKKSQVNNPSMLINYQGLPTSNVSVSDLLEQNNLNDLNAFIFTVGSQAYAQTNLMLNGVNKSYSDINPYEVNSSALMLKLYDLFYNDLSDNHIAVKDFNINFYSFLDIVNTKEVYQASNLLHKRLDLMGQYPNTPIQENPDSNKEEPPKSPGKSNVWKVKNPDTGIIEERPIVKSSGGSSDSIPFNYDPAPNYYEFLPNDGFETKYEKVYFRNQQEIALFNNTIDWMNNYTSSYLSNVSFSKEGTILAAKKINGIWNLKTFAPSSTVEDFIKFYNPEYDNNNDSSSSTSPSA